MKRVDSVDVMRALAIAFMILCHFPIFLSPAEGQGIWLYFFSNHIVGDIAAPFFLFLVGTSQVLSAKKAEATDSAHAGFKRVAVRGGLIFLIGILFLGVMHGFQAIVEWDILTLIGLSLIILYPCRRLPVQALLLICVAVYVVTPWLRGMTEYVLYWGGSLKMTPGISEYLPGILYDPLGDYHPVWGVSKIVSGLLLVGYFPVFPWIIFPLVGFVMGRRLASGRMASDAPFLLIIGLQFCVLGLSGAYVSQRFAHNSPLDHFIAPLSFYPNSATMLFLQIGLTLITFTALWWFFDARSSDTAAPSGFWLTYFRRLSRYSLTLYVLHHVLIFWPLWIVKWTTGKDYFEQAMDSLPAFVLAVAILLILFPALSFWDRHKGRFSLEWLLTWMSGKILKSHLY